MGQPACPPKVMKNSPRSATTFTGSAALPFVISAEAQGRGEICVSAVPSSKCFRQSSRSRNFFLESRPIYEIRNRMVPVWKK